MNAIDMVKMLAEEKGESVPDIVERVLEILERKQNDRQW